VSTTHRSIRLTHRRDVIVVIDVAAVSLRCLAGWSLSRTFSTDWHWRTGVLCGRCESIGPKTCRSVPVRLFPSRTASVDLPVSPSRRSIVWPGRLLAVAVAVVRRERRRRRRRRPSTWTTHYVTLHTSVSDRVSSLITPHSVIYSIPTHPIRYFILQHSIGFLNLFRIMLLLLYGFNGITGIGISSNRARNIQTPG